MFNWFKKISVAEKVAPESDVATAQGGDSIAPLATSESEALKNQGNAHLGNGQLDDAAECFRQAIALNPLYAEAYTNLGFVFRLQSNLGEAVALFRKAALINPNLLPAHLNLGVALMSLGQDDAAEESLRRVIALAPEHPVALQSLGVIAAQRDDFPQAETFLRRALELQPDYAEAHNNLGNLLQLTKRLPEAEASYLRALVLQPDYAEAHNNLGNLLQLTKRLPEAEASYRRALELKPEYADALYNLSSLLMEAKRLPEAETSCRRALELKPDYAEAHNNLGITLHELGRLDEAEASIRQALQINLDYAEAHNNLGNVLKDLGQLDGAVTCFNHAMEIKPDYIDAHSNLLFALNYAASHVPSSNLEQARQFGRIVAEKAGARFSAWLSAVRPERLRVGLVSGDFWKHPVGYFLEGSLAHIDPARIELIAYSTNNKEDELTARIRPYFFAWKSLFGKSDEAAARLIHADGVHILLDLSGHTGHNRLPIFAWKPAPVQASWLGYFATTGVAEMDYLLADEVGVPEDQREQFTESIWYLPDTRLCFTAPRVALPVAPLPALSKGTITFGCFQNLSKVGEDVLAAWGEIFAALPSATLRMQCKQLGKSAQSEQMFQRLMRHGIDPARVELHSAVSRENYLVAHAEVDLILDTFPYPGGTTTCEALWMGVPTLTLMGDGLLARQGASLLTTAGLEEWVAVNKKDYITKAIALSSDLPKLAALRAGLRQQVLASTLFDAPRFARNFEDALWGMWENYMAGQ
jgi:protein O-GlcNAc transferase